MIDSSLKSRIVSDIAHYGPGMALIREIRERLMYCFIGYKSVLWNYITKNENVPKEYNESTDLLVLFDGTFYIERIL